MRWSLLLLLAGCDQIVQLTPNYENPFESTTHDEDMDGRVDAIDLCPHIADHGFIDNDNDGIANECDPRPETADERYFFSFENGNTNRLVGGAPVGPDLDSIVLGSDSHPQSTITLALDADTTNVALRVEILETAVENERIGVAFSELGVHAAHRAFSEDNKQRGDTCYVGIECCTPSTNYIELKEDDVDLGARREDFPSPLAGTGGHITHERSPHQLSCTLDATSRISAAEVRAQPRNITGNVAISARYMKVRIDWLWVVTPKRL